MSTSSPQFEPIKLPPGVVVMPGRETSQTSPQGQIVQGMQFPVQLPSGSTTTVFVPYSVLGNTGYVQGLIEARVNAIMAIGG